MVRVHPLGRRPFLQTAPSDSACRSSVDAKNRDQFLIKARQALRVQRLRHRAELLLNPDAVMHRDVERASARRRLMADLRAAGWWYRLTGERTNDIL
jgi:hypothetical protein